MHGKTTVIPDGRDHFHIIQPVLEPPRKIEEDPDKAMGQVPTREGMYSRVRNTDDFEWDGWRSHD